MGPGRRPCLLSVVQRDGRGLVLLAAKTPPQSASAAGRAEKTTFVAISKGLSLKALWAGLGLF